MVGGVNERIQKLLDEAETISQLSDGNGHRAADFVTWRKRAEAALTEKLGSDSAQVLELASLDFYFNPRMTVNGEPAKHPTGTRQCLTETSGLQLRC